VHYRQQDEAEQPQQALIPPVEQPRGAQYFLSTWSGRIILLNTLVYLLTAWQAKSLAIMSFDLPILLDMGAKDPVLLAQGQLWRLVTPMFVHGGLIHFAFNNWALYVLGYQLEHLLKPGRFMALYVLSGVGGNIASAVWSISPSVGASGALFGLMGCGFYVERTIQSRIQQMTGFKPRTGVYTGMVFANIIFGFIIPQIDNAAHMGGLLVGVTFAYILLRVRPNRLIAPQQVRGWVVAAILGLSFLAGSTIGSSQQYVLYRLQSAIQSADQVGERYFYLNRLVQLVPQDEQGRLHRLILALQLRDYTIARVDLLYLFGLGAYDKRLHELVQELSLQGFPEGSLWLQQALEQLKRTL
jgi:membrane associated rhomboid family serine protease